MTDIVDLKFRADTKELDSATTKLVGLTKGMPSVSKVADELFDSIKKLNSGVALLGATIVVAAGGLFLLAKSALEQNAALLELANTTMMSVKEAQVMKEVFEQTGSSAEKMQATMIKFNRAVSDSADPLSKTASALKLLGVSQQQLQNLSPAKQFELVAASLSKLADGTAKSRIENELFGKTGPEINRVLKEFGEGVKEADERLKAYGIEIDDADAAMSEKLLSSVAAGSKMFGKFGQDLVQTFIPAFQSLAEEFIDSGKKGGFLRESIDALSIVFKVFGQVVFTVGNVVLRPIVLIFKEMITSIQGFSRAIAAIVNHDYKEALNIAKETAVQMAKNFDDAAKAMEKNVKLTWEGADAYKSMKKTANEHLEAVKKLNKLRADALELQNASDKSADAFNKKLQEEKANTVAINIQHKAELEMLTMSVHQIEKRKIMMDAELKLTKEIAKINAQHISGEEKTRQTKQLTEEINNQRDARLRNVDAIHAEKTGTEGLYNGAIKGIKDWGDSATNTYDSMKQASGKWLDSAASGLVEFVNTGKMDFKGFALSIIKDIEMMIAKQLMFNAIKSATAGTSFAGMFANGAAFDKGNVMAFASGGVVNTPTVFPMANGSGLMGEAGPEAVMPLQRTSDGRLGVATTGGGKGDGVAIGNINITIQRSDKTTDQEQAALIANEIKKISKKEIADARRSGNANNPISTSFAF